MDQHDFVTTDNRCMYVQQSISLLQALWGPLRAFWIWGKDNLLGSMEN